MLEREIERERERERERVRKSLEFGHALCLQVCAHTIHRSEREIEREIGWERERARCGICPELFFKGMTGALAPFSYLVDNKYK